MPEILGTSKSVYGFDPRSMGGCILWLDGTDPTTLYSDAAGTTLATVGGAVRRWKDKSGLGNDFSNRSANTNVYYPTYASTSGVTIVNSGAPSYNAGTYMLLQSVTNFLAFPYYTIYSAINLTSGGVLPTIFACPRNPAVESRSPQFECGGAFSLGGPTWAFSNSRWSFGDYVGTSGGNAGYTAEQAPTGVITVMGLTSGKNSNVTYVAGNRAGGGGNIGYTPYSTCSAPAFIGGCFYLVNAGSADNRFFNGTVHETLVFNSELTSNQCQEIEGYLSWKWGRQSALPSNHPFYSIAPRARTFTPIDIPGCQLWLDGADITSMTFTSQPNVKIWKDKSGYLRNFNIGSGTPVFASNGVTLANCYMYATSAVDLTNFSFFIVAKSLDATKSNQTVFGARPSNTTVYNSSDGFGFYLDTLSGFRFYGSNTSLSYVSNTSTTISTPVLWSFTSASGAINPWINGSSTTSATGLGARTSTAQGFAIGGEWNGSAYGNFSNMSSTIYEAIVYNAALTNVQRQAVEGYLAWKWGLNASLSTGNVLCKFPPSSIQQFKPTDINACALWLDAADPAATGTGTTLSTWYDKSGNGSNATANSSISLLSNAVNGNTVLSVSVGTPQWLLGNIAITGTGMTVVSAFKMDSNSGGAARIIGLAATSTNDYNSVSYVGILRQTSNNMGAYRNNAYAGPLLTYSVPTIGTTYFDGSNGYSYINGGAASSIAITSNFSITSYAIMANTNTADAHYFSGYMCEMIVYNTALTSPQRQQVEGYLAKKWNIQLETTHPYYSINPAHMVGGTGIITPSNLPGLILWNRADTISVGSGNAVGTWTNSSNTSGPTITCTGTQSNAALNNLNVVNFTTAQTWTSSTALTPSSYTFIHLARQTPSTWGRVFQSSVAGTNHLHGYWAALKETWYNEGWLSYPGAGVASDMQEWAIITSTRISGGAFECRWNGTIIAQGTTSAAKTLEGLAINTGGAAAGEVSTCQVAEVILYNSVLTRSQIIGIEEYLRQKWGLGVN